MTTEDEYKLIIHLENDVMFVKTIDKNKRFIVSIDDNNEKTISNKYVNCLELKKLLENGKG